MDTYNVYRESLVDIVSRLLAGLWFDSSVHVGSATHLVSSSMAPMVHFPRNKGTGMWSWPRSFWCLLTLWCSTSTPPCAFMVWAAITLPQTLYYATDLLICQETELWRRFLRISQKENVLLERQERDGSAMLRIIYRKQVLETPVNWSWSRPMFCMDHRPIGEEYTIVMYKIIHTCFVCVLFPNNSR